MRLGKTPVVVRERSRELTGAQWPFPDWPVKINRIERGNPRHNAALSRSSPLRFSGWASTSVSNRLMLLGLGCSHGPIILTPPEVRHRGRERIVGRIPGYQPPPQLVEELADDNGLGQDRRDALQVTTQDDREDLAEVGAWMAGNNAAYWEGEVQPHRGMAGPNP